MMGRREHGEIELELRSVHRDRGGRGPQGCSSDRVEITGNMILTVEVRIEELLLLIPVLLAVER